MTLKGDIQMKDFIVFLALTMLGIFIATLIWSDDEGSLKDATKNLMENQITALGD